MTAVPWVIGQWVRGPLFYGREAEIAALQGALRAGARRLWVAGLRRVGKTSLLRQIELLALAALDDRGGGRPLLPLFWDLEGADRAAELAGSFADALLDAEESLARLGIAVREVEDGDLFAVFARLHRALERRGAELLLLCDEADQLAPLARAEPELVRALWPAAAGGAGRVLIASSVRLADLAAADLANDGGTAAAAVEGFGAPHLLGCLTAGEARSLLRQERLPAAARPGFDGATVEAIRGHCGDHPMLLQLAGRRVQESGELDAALAALAADRAVERLFAVDFELLTAAERAALEAIAEGECAGAADPADPGLRRLLALGLVERSVLPRSRGAGGRRLGIRGRLLAAWLRR